MWEMTYIFGNWLMFDVGNDVDLWEKLKYVGK